MIRSLAVSVAAVALALAPVSAVASAQPDASACDYTLSPPHVVSVSGTDMVAVTMSPAACDSAIPFMSVACVQLQGAQGPGKCIQNNGTLSARAYLSPYRPGGTYVATGTGCASTGNPPQPVCQSAGPLSATL
ncbi:hypothetical protein ABGB19_13900 [Mycobacterium sp. B14F4]|uniref:hypothetical protein n=1 Tax=Mycobacterium sp. B14F4 TaxID=3153565 RepID=UPI00325C759D